jgi:hypothetical protein
MTKYDAPPSPDLTEAELDALMTAAISGDVYAEAPEPEMLSAVELILLSAEHRFGRMANALETAAKAATAGANNVEALTAQVHRLADAFEAMAGFMGCITERVEGQDGVYRGYVRHNRTTNGLLSYADDRDHSGED